SLDPWCEQLIQTARGGDDPTLEQKRRAYRGVLRAAALGIGLTSAASAGARGLSLLTTSLKVTVVAATVGLSSYGVYHALSSRHSEPTAKPQPSVSARVIAKAPTAAPTETEVVPSAQPVEAPKPLRSVSKKSLRDAETPTDLDGEVKLLRAAQSALTAGDPGR